MIALEAPYDRVAEQAVIGCVISSERGRRLAARYLSSSDFYRPAHQLLFDASSAMADLDGADLDTEDARIGRLAEIAGVDESEVCRLVEDRPLQWDLNGTLAKRVLRAAEERRAMQAAIELANRLGSGEHLDQVAADLAPKLRHLLSTAS